MDLINELNGDTKIFISSEDVNIFKIKNINHKIIINGKSLSISDEINWIIAYELETTLKDIWLNFKQTGTLCVTDIQKLRIPLPKERMEHITLDKEIDTYEKFKVLVSTKEFQNMMDRISIFRTKY